MVPRPQTRAESVAVRSVSNGRLVGSTPTGFRHTFASKSTPNLVTFA